MDCNCLGLPFGRWWAPGVLMGNWFENLALEEEHIKDFLKKRDENKMLCPETLAIARALEGKVDISTSRDGKVHFGDVIVLLNPPPKDESRRMHALTMTWTDLGVYDFAETMCTQTGKVAASSCCLLPNIRNTFIVKSCDGSHAGEPLRYDQPFYLTTSDGRLYLRSDRFDFQTMSKWAHKPEITLDVEPHHLAEWCVKPFNPLIRMELKYSPVQCNAKVIVTHVKTNTNLCLESFHATTSFGFEKEVTLHTVLDTHKAEMAENHWMFMMKVPGDCIQPVVEPNVTTNCGPPCRKNPDPCDIDTTS